MKYTDDQIKILDQLGESLEADRPNQLDADLEQQLSMYESGLLQPENI